MQPIAHRANIELTADLVTIAQRMTATPPPSLQQRALLNSVVHPTVLLPVALGATWLLGNFALATSAVWAWASAAALVAGGLAMAGWRYASNHAAELKAWNENLHTRQLDEREAELDTLAQRLASDDDQRTQAFLADLRICAQRCDELVRNADLSDPINRSIIVDVEALVDCGLAALAKAASLWDRAQALTSNTARDPLLAERARLIEEIEATVRVVSDQLATIHQRQQADDVPADPASRLAELRARLDTNLAVAKRVDARMSSLDADLAERYDS